MLPLFLSLLIFSPFFSRECSSQHVAPALYVFGDSLTDNGNNNHLNAAKADFRPYGINFPGGISTGRFTNGRTLPDLIAGYLGLPYPPAYRGDVRSRTGYNYASAACGILPETGSHLGCLDFDAQLSLFEKTIDEELGPWFITPAKLARYLANSIFFVWSGNNDYLLNYFLDPSPVINPQDFAQLLIDRLSDKLKRLHELGARKLLVLDMGPLGCIPVYRKNGGHNETWCNDNFNSYARMFNDLLGPLIQNMSTTYKDTYFTRGKVYDISNDAFRNPAKYDLTNVHSSCCTTLTGGVANNIPCFPLLPSQYPCANPNEYLFFDGAHPTEASFQILANPCFNGADVCVPYNIKQLVQLPTNSAVLRSAA